MSDRIIRSVLKRSMQLAWSDASMSDRIIRSVLKRSMQLAWSDAVDFLKNFFFGGEQEEDDKDETEDKQAVSMSNETRVEEKRWLNSDMRSMFIDMKSFLVESEHKLKEAKDTISDLREKMKIDRWRDAVALVKIGVF